MANVPFVKATACGNDFLIIDFAACSCRYSLLHPPHLRSAQGVGADGVEWILPAKDADLGVRLLNADGSEAEISGNGTRCVAAWYCAENHRDSVVIRTGAGLKTCKLTARDGNTFEFRSSMGEPEVGDDFSIKFAYGEMSRASRSRWAIRITWSLFRSSSWAGRRSPSRSPLHHDFKHGMNVEFVKVMNEDEIEVRFCERGVGETMSSGTGSCAAAVASIHTGKVKSPVRVHAPGGAQTVEWSRRSVSHRTGNLTLPRRVFHLR